MSENRLYQQEIMEEYQNSRFRRSIDNPDIKGYMINPSCGDAVTFELKLVNDKVSEVGFQGSGCVISQAAASLMSGYILDKKLQDIKNMTPEDVLKLVKIPLGPTRLRCALLSLQALQIILTKDNG